MALGVMLALQGDDSEALPTGRALIKEIKHIKKCLLSCSKVLLQDRGTE